MNQDFTMRTTPAYLDGIFMALAGVPDLWAVIDAPPCLPELLDRGMLGHAWRQSLVRRDGRDRLFSTDQSIGKPEEIRLARQLGRLEALAKRHGPPGAILVSEMAPARLQAGSDLPALAARISRLTGAPARVVSSLSLTRDFLDSFPACLDALAESLPASACTGGQDSVAVIGYMLDRREADHTANVRELERLLSALGLKTSAVWTCGEPCARLARAGASRRLISLPYGAQAAKTLSRRSGAAVLATALPIGLDGTCRWLRQVAARWGRRERAERFIAAELKDLAPRIAPLVSRVCAGGKVALIADPALAAGLADYLRELGLEVVGPVLRSRHADDPSQASLAAVIGKAQAEGPIDLVIGSSWEREALAGCRLPFLELGFPSLHERPLTDAPFLGFAGALRLAEKICVKISEGRYERLPRADAAEAK